MQQLTHYQISNQQKKFPITIVCDALRTPENIGMIFRIADSFGVEKIFLHQFSPEIDNRKVVKTARNTIQNTAYAYYEDFEQLLSNLKAQGNLLLGLEITDQSIPIQNFSIQQKAPITLIVGSERQGIHNLKNMDATVYVPMYGKNSSMNVVHSLSICLYDLTNKFNAIQQ